MPYKPEELEANEHYQGLKTRDEVAYHAAFERVKEKQVGSDTQKGWDGLRDDDDVLQIFEDPETGLEYDNWTQRLRVLIYQVRYRTNADTKDILDRQFKEF